MESRRACSTPHHRIRVAATSYLKAATSIRRAQWQPSSLTGCSHSLAKHAWTRKAAVLARVPRSIDFDPGVLGEACDAIALFAYVLRKRRRRFRLNRGALFAEKLFHLG